MGRDKSSVDVAIMDPNSAYIRGSKAEKYIDFKGLISPFVLESSSEFGSEAKKLLRELR